VPISKAAPAVLHYAGAGQKSRRPICIGINDDIYDPRKTRRVSQLPAARRNCLAPRRRVPPAPSFGVQHGFHEHDPQFILTTSAFSIFHTKIYDASSGRGHYIIRRARRGEAIGEVISRIERKAKRRAFRIRRRTVS